jgi:hypothetical protein
MENQFPSKDLNDSIDSRSINESKNLFFEEQIYGNKKRNSNYYNNESENHLDEDENYI